MTAPNRLSSTSSTRSPYGQPNLCQRPRALLYNLQRDAHRLPGSQARVRPEEMNGMDVAVVRWSARPGDFNPVLRRGRLRSGRRSWRHRRTLSSRTRVPRPHRRPLRRALREARGGFRRACRRMWRRHGALSIGALQGGDGAVDPRCRVARPDRGADHDAVVRRDVDHSGFDCVGLPVAGAAAPREYTESSP